MPMRSALILSLLLAAATASAQSIGEPIPGQTVGKSKNSPWNSAGKPARPCPEYGPGFVRLEGATACVRIGGSVSVEYGVGSRGRSGSAASGTVRLDTRDETTLGPVRTTLQVRGRIDRGLDGYGYNYGYR